MSAADQVTPQADFQKEQLPVIDVFHNTSLSDMQAAVMRNQALPIGERPTGGYSLPSVEVVACGNTEQKPGEAAIAPTARESTNQTKSGDQTKTGDQTKEHSGEPAKRSPLAQQMQRMAQEADKNAKARANGEPVADSTSHPAERPQVPMPGNDKEYKFHENQAAHAEAKAANEGKRVVYHFGATWCPGCQKMKNESWNNQDHRVDDAVKDKGILVDIDVDKTGAAELQKRFGITSIPATVIVEPGKNGTPPKEIARQGYMPENDLIDWLNKKLK